MSKQKRSFGIIRDIKCLLTGLGKYTFEGGMIYTKSLLRSSILYAAETMYNIKENERIDENMLRQLFKTGNGCSIYQLYFESGQLPARYQIKRMKLVFYRYILTQDKDSLMFKFLFAQKMEPTKNYWYSEVQEILKEFEIEMTEEEIVNKSSTLYNNIVKKKAVTAGIKYLKTKQLKGEMGRKIQYNNLELQDYLNPCSNINLEDQRLMFSLRCEMNPLKSNFRRNMEMKEEYCVQECGKELDNSHITWCDILNTKEDYTYENLLNGTLEEKIGTLNQIKQNEKRRMRKPPL
jgi:hypothetical protein